MSTVLSNVAEFRFQSRRTLDFPTVIGLVVVIPDDELRCEFRHPAGHPCLVVVSHRVRSCRNSALVCRSAAELIGLWFLDGSRCRGCARPLGVCWRVFAV